MAAMSPMRKRVLWMALAIGVALLGERAMTLGASGDDSVAAAAPARVRPVRAVTDQDARTIAAQDTVLRLDRLDARQKALDAARDQKPARDGKGAKTSPFETVSFAAPPPPPPAPPKPTAPPFPYTYMGAMADAGVRTVFFNQGDRALAVKQGDTVDGRYRVDQMTDRQMRITYLPLNQSMTVAIGGGQ